jgi:hypothetical protein
MQELEEITEDHYKTLQEITLERIMLYGRQLERKEAGSGVKFLDKLHLSNEMKLQLTKLIKNPNLEWDFCQSK